MTLLLRPSFLLPWFCSLFFWVVGSSHRATFTSNRPTVFRFGAGRGSPVGSFITMWVWIDKRSPGRYDTFFEFAPYETKKISELEAVRWVSPDGNKLKVDETGKPVEVVVKFKRGVGAKSNTFFEEGTGLPPSS